MHNCIIFCRGVYFCYYCSKSFSTRSNLVRHERSHEATTRYSCRRCDVSTSRRDDLRKHYFKFHAHNVDEVKEIKVRLVDGREEKENENPKRREESKRKEDDREDKRKKEERDRRKVIQDVTNKELEDAVKSIREEDPDIEAETDKITLDYDENISDGEVREEEESKKEEREDTRRSEIRGGRGVKKIRKEDKPEEASDSDSGSESGSGTSSEEEEEGEKQKKIKFTFKPTDIPVPQTKNPVKEIEIVETFNNRELTERRIIYRMDVTQ